MDTNAGAGIQAADMRTHFFPIHRHLPVIRETLISRTLAHRPALILLRGPGGISKSVTATQIATAFVERDTSAESVWIRFDASESGIESVWSRILQRVQDARLLPPDSLAERLADGGVTSVGAVIAALRERTAPLLLILDDAQESITPDIEATLLDVLEHVEQLTIIITTRKPMPLLSSAKVALRIPVSKLTQNELHFSEDEVLQLVRLRFPDEQNPTAVAQFVYEQTLGWPLAVHGLLVERNALLRRDAEPLDTKHRKIFLRELVDQTLSHSDPGLHRMLCLIAQYEEVSDDMLAYALDIPHDACGELIEQAHAEHLDYWINDEGTRWYRLHQLVAEELRSRIPELIPAPRWHAMALRLARAAQHDRPRTAIQAAIIAQDWELLSDLLTKGTALTLSRTGQPVSLNSIPDHVKRDYPVIAAFSLIHEYAFPSGMYRKAVAGFKALTSRALKAQSRQPGFPGLTAAVLKMIISRIIGNESIAVQMADLVTEKIQLLDSEDRRKHSTPLQIAANITAITYLHVGRFHDARALLAPMRAWSNSLQPKSRSHAAALSAWAAVFDGDLESARIHLRDCEQFDTPVGWRESYIGAGYRIAAAALALEEGELDVAQVHIDAMAEHESTIEHWPYLTFVQALIVESRYGLSAARKYLESRRSRRGATTSTTPYMRRMLDSLHARVSWQTGRVLPLRKRTRDMISVYGALSRNDVALALARTSELSELPFVLESPRRHAEVLLLQAVASLRNGDQSKAVEHANSATALMVAYGFSLPMRVVPQDIARELAQLVPDLPREQAATAKIRMVTPLTPSEQRALITVVQYGSVPKAADAMYLSRETVKGYIKQVYRKLGVNSREEAVKVAAEAGLLHADHRAHDAP